MVHHHLSPFFFSANNITTGTGGGGEASHSVSKIEKIDLRRGFDQLPNVVFDVTFNQTFQSPIAVSLISHILGGFGEKTG
jgi:hypothetical protein